MFGRKGLGGNGGAGGGSGGTGPGTGGPRPDRGLGSVVLPGWTIDRAMCAAIAVMGEALSAAGQHPGALAIDDAPVPGTSNMIAQCITYDGAAGPEYVTLGVTRDFEAFSYQPHCFLFLISNAVGICEDLPDRETRGRIAASQCVQPLFHAHVMRRWCRHVLPVGEAMTERDDAALGACLEALKADILEVMRDAPVWMRERCDLPALAGDWISGFPATIGRPLDGSEKRLNGIPMPEFVHRTLVDWLTGMQAQAMVQGRRA